MLGLLDELDRRIAALDKEISRRAREDEVARRLMTIPEIGPITATAIAALAPAMETFRRGRDFAAWLGLVPRQKSTGGKTRLGRISKMGDRTLRRFLIIGASAVVQHAARRLRRSRGQGESAQWRAVHIRLTAPPPWRRKPLII
jgi:transposase